MDATQPAQPPPEETAAQESAGPVIKRVSAKAGVRMCAICMASVAEQDLVEHEGQRICQDCAENLRKKAMKKAGMGPPPPPPPKG